MLGSNRGRGPRTCLRSNTVPASPTRVATNKHTGQTLEDFEAALSRAGDGRPAVTEELLVDFIREADTFEAEFVVPVSAAELAEQQEEAAAAAAAASSAAAAADGDGEQQQQEVKPPPPKSKKKGAAGAGNKKGKGPGFGKPGFGKKGKKADEGGEDDMHGPDAGAHRGPLLALFSGATRVRKRNAPPAAAADGAGAAAAVGQEGGGHIKQEDGGSGGGGDGAAAAVKPEPMDTDGADPAAAAAAANGSSSSDDVTKMVCPLEELDDSGE